MRPANAIAMLLALILSAGSIALAAPRRRAAAPVPDEVTITFVSRPGLLDLGSVAHTARNDKHDRTVRSETIQIRLDRRGGSRGSASLRAYLVSPDARCSIRIDGRLLGATPVVIDPQIPIGALTSHRIDVEVPVSAPEGPLSTTIGWEASTN
ncbi:MAG TPA: hypothetical protein VH087_16490 [Thermoanaerobaculia bacterium]|nr:hypothetical protein [Thermoanaerobaculia bacterium]